MPSRLPSSVPLHLHDVAAGRLAAHCVAGYPHEVCGLLIGVDHANARNIVDAIAVDNVWEDKHEHGRRFTLDPLRQMQIERSLEGTGKSVLGFYHSHPDHPAEPSAFDLEAAWVFYSYVIVSTVRDQTKEIRSWVLDDATGEFAEQTIERLKPAG